MQTFRVDLHCHSFYSRTTDNKLMLAFCVNESYSSPNVIYKLAKKRGMDAVTITDHNTIRGALKLKEKHDDVFASEEICTFFPEDNYRMHVVAVDIDEAIHAEISRLRSNVYDLVAFFRENKVLHFLAHPSWASKSPPRREHYEKFMVLFDKWEFLNGSRSWKNHDFCRALAGSYDLEKATLLADKHKLPAPAHRRIIGLGGSDYHTVRGVGNAYTQATGVTNYKEFLEKIWQGEVSYDGTMQTSLPLTQSVYDVIGKHYAYGQAVIVHKVKDKPTKALAKLHFSPLKRFLRRKHWLSYTTEQLAADLDKLVRKNLRHMTRKLVSWRGLDLSRDVIHRLTDMGIIFAPLLSSTAHKFKIDRQLPKGDDFFPTVDDGLPRKVAVFGDMLHQQHGVSTRIRQLMRHAKNKNHVMIPVACAEKPVEDFVTLKPVEVLTLPQYQGIEFCLPSFVETLRFLEREKIDLVHVASPGPIGFTALVAAKLVGLPVIGSFHTDVGEYITHYNTNPVFKRIFAKLQAFFYEHCDLVLALSDHSRKYLAGTGVPSEKIHLMRTGVDQEIFNPDKKSPAVRQRLNPDNRFMILFAGRLEKEKNIATLMTAFDKVYQANNHTMLVIAGSGNLKKEIANHDSPRYPEGVIKCLDWVNHQEMAEIFASSDMLLFPSATETFGNVILEAQSCALPTVVSNLGAAHELVENGKTGFICSAYDPDGFANATLRLIQDREMHQLMRQNAALRSREYSWPNAVEHLFAEYSGTG